MGSIKFNIITINKPNKNKSHTRKFSSRNILSTRKFTEETMEEKVKKINLYNRK